MKLPLLIALLALPLCSVATAATVLTNTSGAPGSPQLIKGPGGFISQPISVGFEFTVGSHPDDWVFQSLSLTFSSNSGTNPLNVEIFSSPTGPDTATLITTLAGPANPTAGTHSWVAPTALTLVSGQTYFVQLSVPGGPSTYGIARTSGPATGDWTLGAAYSKGGSATWNLASGATPFLTINAIPEPSGTAGLAGVLALAFLLRRRVYAKS